jgi:hypothetical protein
LWEPLGAFPPPQLATASATAAIVANAGSLRVAADSVRFIDWTPVGRKRPAPTTLPGVCGALDATIAPRERRPEREQMSART